MGCFEMIIWCLAFVFGVALIIAAIMGIKYGQAYGFILAAAIIISIVIFVMIKRKRNAEEKAREEENKKALAIEHDKCRPTIVGSTLNDRFFVECLLTNCYDFSLQKNVERAKLIAQKYNLSYPNGIPNLFEQAKNYHKTASKSVWECIRRKQRVELVELTKYSNYVGKEKRIAMLTDEMNKYLDAANAAKQAAYAMENSVYQEKEHSWGIAGGIASGIAGAGAGYAAAAQTQAENESIRARNQANLRYAAMQSMSMYDKAGKWSTEADRLKEMIEVTKNKLIQMPSPESVMSQIQIKRIKTEISHSGYVIINILLTQKDKIHIFDDVPAYADGYVVAHVWNNEKKIGSAKLVLPLDGTSEECEIKGICIADCPQGADIKLSIAPGNLWLMEK